MSCLIDVRLSVLGRGCVMTEEVRCPDQLGCDGGGLADSAILID